MFGRRSKTAQVYRGGGAPPVLAVEGMSIRFGGLQALEGLNLEVNEYEIVGLIGPNGAGKTTAFNCITGLYQPDAGSVRFKGVEVTRTPPHVRASLGIGRTFQNVGMVKSATALENLRAAQHVRAAYSVGGGLVGSPAFYRSERELKQRAESILELLGLGEIRDELVGGQPYGTLKLLELGCAIATDPELLLLDEPTSGMGPEESEQLGDRLLALRRELQLTMLVIEHHVPLVLRVCDHVYVLNFGRLLAEGEPSMIQTHPEVVAAYLGGEAPEALEQTEEPEEDAALEAEIAEHGHGGGEVEDEAPDEAENVEAGSAATTRKPRRTRTSKGRAKPRAAAEVQVVEVEQSQVEIAEVEAAEPEHSEPESAAELDEDSRGAEADEAETDEWEEDALAGEAPEFDEGEPEAAGSSAAAGRERRGARRPSEVGDLTRAAKSAESFRGAERRGGPHPQSEQTAGAAGGKRRGGRRRERSEES